MLVLDKSSIPVLGRMMDHVGSDSVLDFCEKTGEENTRVYGWTKRKSVPFDAVRAFADRYGLNLYWLLDGIEPKYVRELPLKKIAQNGAADGAADAGGAA